jgi:hypothetical protein
MLRPQITYLPEKWTVVPETRNAMTMAMRTFDRIQMLSTIVTYSACNYRAWLYKGQIPMLAALLMPDSTLWTTTRFSSLENI